LKILTKELVLEAIDLALPSIRPTVAANTWGPLGLVIAVSEKSLTDPVVYVMEELGSEESWAEKWEGKNFRKIALQKLLTSLHGEASSREVVANYPWLLDEGDSLYVGAIFVKGLAITASGAFGDTDEEASWEVFRKIQLLCRRRIAELQEKGINCL
jgi:hypothetical protein